MYAQLIASFCCLSIKTAVKLGGGAPAWQGEQVVIIKADENKEWVSQIEDIKSTGALTFSHPI